MEQMLLLIACLPSWLLWAIIGFSLPILFKGFFKLYKRCLLWIQTDYLKKGYSIFEVPKLQYCRLKKLIKNIFGKKTEENRHPNRQHKGLVGVLAININKVLSVVVKNSGAGLREIYFAEKEGDYYNRNTHLDADEIRKQVDVIQRYYRNIEASTPQKWQTKPIFIYEEEINGELKSSKITEKLVQIYSYDNVKKYIDKVNKEMTENNAIHFVGDKIGVSDFQLDKGDLQLVIYKTDHFTWQVFKEIFKANKSFFQEVILRVNSTSNNDEKRILVQCLAFLFSSFGIDIVIESVDCQKQKKLIISARSGKIESNKESSLHVSVNETFSRTDNVGESETHYNLYTCVKRGIQEEIGIPEDEIEDSMIVFQDFAIVTDEGEIGLSCYVNLSKVMPIEQILMYPGQDKFLENEELLVLPYFKINHLALIKSMYSKRFMHQFYLQTMNDRFNMPWMSFTPLLISRIMIRNFEYTWKVQTILYVFFWLGMIIYSILSSSLPTQEVIVDLAENIPGVILNALALWWLNRNKKFDYKYIQPFVSQWYGNAKAVQLIGGKDRVDNSGIELNIRNEGLSDGAVNLSDLVMEAPPKCEVRVKKGKNSYAEKPVSFFYMKNKGKKLDGAQLHFMSMNVSCDNINAIVGITFFYKTDDFTNVKKIKKISFIDECPYTLRCNHIKKFGEYSMINSAEFINDYYVQDLFLYKGDYYWSCIPKKGVVNDDITDLKFQLVNKKNSWSDTSPVKSIYENVEKFIALKNDKEGFVHVLLQGENRFIQHWLINFVGHLNNKRRISELERYMLQVYLIRHKILFADCVYCSNKVQYKIYSA